MKLFISWSGPISQQIAGELRAWIPLILPAVEPFVTTTDVDKGARWQGEISDELSKSNYGIVCLTRENLSSMWLAFEAGALSKHLEGRVATVLFGLRHSDVHPPLSMFQGTLFDEADFRKLIDNMDAATVEQHRGSQQLDKVFPAFWSQLDNPVKLILEGAEAIEPEPERKLPNIEAISQEMLALLRQQNAVLSAPEKFFAPILRALESNTLPNSLSLEINPAARQILASSLLNRVRQKNVKTAAEALTEEQPSPSEPPDGN